MKATEKDLRITLCKARREVCCDKMKALMAGMGFDTEGSVKWTESKGMVRDLSEPWEYYFPSKLKIPTIEFNFCPYCGKKQLRCKRQIEALRKILLEKANKMGQ